MVWMVSPFSCGIGRRRFRGVCLCGDFRFAEYLHVPYIAYNSDVTVVCGAMVGAGLGFYGLMRIPPQVLWVMLVH